MLWAFTCISYFSRKHASLPLQLCVRERQRPWGPRFTPPPPPSGHSWLAGHDRVWPFLPQSCSSLLVGWHLRGSDLTRPVTFLRGKYINTTPFGQLLLGEELDHSDKRKSAELVVIFFWPGTAEKKIYQWTDLCSSLFFWLKGYGEEGEWRVRKDSVCVRERTGLCPWEDRFEGNDQAVMTQDARGLLCVCSLNHPVPSNAVLVTHSHTQKCRKTSILVALM